MGKYNDNSYCNSIVYEVEFADGQIREYTANLIAEGMLVQVDTEGNLLQLMEGIVNWKRDNSVAIPKVDKDVYNKHDRWRLCKTTQGWWLLVLFFLFLFCVFCPPTFCCCFFVFLGFVCVLKPKNCACVARRWERVTGVKVLKYRDPQAASQRCFRYA